MNAIVSAGLSAASSLYGAVASRRRAWYVRSPDRQRRLRQPVISVGNLSVGGSGKTPVVAHLARMLQAFGERPAILSRGYGRRVQDDGVTVVSDGTQVRADFDHAGDEPLMLARALPGVPVVVASERHLAGRLAESQLGATVHLLDDGFQHVQLWRDINLLVKSKGSSITASGPLATAAIPLPGTIVFDNTNGGLVTQATAVAGVGLTFNGGGVFGNKGITLTGVSNNNSAITSNQTMTSALGSVVLTGNTLTAGNLWGINATGTLTGKSITVTATNNTTGTLTTGGAVNLGALSILAGGTNLTITGNNSNQAAQGIVASGAITNV